MKVSKAWCRTDMLCCDSNVESDDEKIEVAVLVVVH